MRRAACVTGVSVCVCLSRSLWLSDRVSVYVCACLACRFPRVVYARTYRVSAGIDRLSPTDSLPLGRSFFFVLRLARVLRLTSPRARVHALRYSQLHSRQRIQRLGPRTHTYTRFLTVSLARALFLSPCPVFKD